MTPSLKASLYIALSSWLDDHCEDEDNRPDGLYHPDLPLHMTNAAEAVYDTSFASSQYTEQNTA